MKMKTLTRVRRRAPKFRIWTSKIMPDLWLVALFCPIKKKFHTPPYCLYPTPTLPVPHSPLPCTACTPLPRCLYPIPPCLYCLNPTPTAFDHFCTRSKPSFSTARSFSHYVQTVFFERSDFDKKNIYNAILTVFKQYHHKM